MIFKIPQLFKKAGTASVEFNRLTLQMPFTTKEEYRNISKHKRIKVPVVSYQVRLFINDIEMDDVFVVDEYFKSLEQEGTYPMFTCTCGIFGCGGYYIEVIYHKNGLKWVTKHSPFKDYEYRSPNSFLFTWKMIATFTEKLISYLDKLNKEFSDNGLRAPYELAHYISIAEKIRMKA